MTTQSYPLSLVILHWLMAILIIALFALGLYISDLASTPRKLILTNVHMSFGVVTAVLLLARLYVRLSRSIPPPSSEKNWEKLLANTVYTLFYVCLAVIVISGFMQSIFSYGITIFNVVHIPGSENKVAAAIFHAMHSFFTSIILPVLVFLHLAGTIKHIISNSNFNIIKKIFSL